MSEDTNLPELRLIPALDDATGMLPPGRYTCTMAELEREFVRHRRFAGSDTRQRVFVGLIQYLATWQEIQRKTTPVRPLLRGLWVAGSFVTAKLDPGDMDITPIVDAPAVDSIRGRPGAGGIRHLTKHRDGIKRRYGLEVFALTWQPVVRPLRAGGVTVDEHAYLSDRGRYDDLWQRARVDEADIPTEDGCVSRRGYLEVRL